MSKRRLFLVVSAALVATLVTIAALKRTSPEFKTSAKNEVKSLRNAVAARLGLAGNKQSEPAVVSPASIAAGPAASPSDPAASEPTAPRAAVVSMFDHVDLYQKNGLVETYGASLRQRKSGPVAVSASLLQVTHDDAWVIWSPDATPASIADAIELRFVDPNPASGSVVIGLIMRSGRAVIFETLLGPIPPAQNPAPAAHDLPGKYREALARAVRYPLRTASDGSRWARLPPEIVRELNSPEVSSAIINWIVGINGAAPSELGINRLSLVTTTAPPSGPLGVTAAGKVAGAVIPPGATVELLTDTGKRFSQSLSLDGDFRFEGLNPGRPVSLRYRHLKQDHYANLGRWFAPEWNRADLVIDLRPRFVNPDGHAPDPKKARFVGRSPPISYFTYEPHTWQYWPGAGPIQEFDSTTFANNHGFIDRDRYFDNPDNCFRIAHLGASTAVSLQVRPFEKYNLLLEAELGVMLGRCVEVISAGRDNGDIGALFRVARDYAAKFKPDLLIIENSNHHLMQIQPQLLKKFLGWDQEHNVLDSFYYAQGGKLQFREASSDWGIYTSSPDQTSLIKGISFWQTMMVPEANMHRFGKDAFRYLVDIVRYYQQNISGPRIVLNSGLDQAQCKKECYGSAVLQDGRKIPIGVKVLVDTYRQICAREKLDCINPPIPVGYDRPEVLLNFVHDGHYSVRGHQWYSAELAAGVQRILLH